MRGIYRMTVAIFGKQSQSQSCFSFFFITAVCLMVLHLFSRTGAHQGATLYASIGQAMYSTGTIVCTAIDHTLSALMIYSAKRICYDMQPFVGHNYILKLTVSGHMYTSHSVVCSIVWYNLPCLLCMFFFVARCVLPENEIDTFVHHGCK